MFSLRHFFFFCLAANRALTVGIVHTTHSHWSVMDPNYFEKERQRARDEGILDSEDPADDRLAALLYHLADLERIGNSSKSPENGEEGRDD